MKIRTAAPAAALLCGLFVVADITTAHEASEGAANENATTPERPASARLTGVPADGAEGGVAGASCADCPYCVTDSCNLPDQTGHGLGGTIGATSDANPGFAVAENLDNNVGALPFFELCWWGFYIDFGGPTDCGAVTPPADSFSLTLFADDNGSPGAVLSGPNPIIVTSRTATQTIPSSIGPIQEYQYRGFSGDPIPGGCVWIQIQNDAGAGTCFWLWSTTAAGQIGDEKSHQNTDGTYTPSTVNDFDLALCFDDLAFPCPPPSASCTGSVANDCCSDATPVTGTASLAFDTTTANTDGPDDPANPCNSGSSDTQIWKDLWYEYTATEDGFLRVSTCLDANFDSKIAAYDVSGANPAFRCDTLIARTIACNEDCAADAVSFTSELVVPIAAGDVHLVRLGGFSSDNTEAMAESGSGTISFEVFQAPTGDDTCSAAVPEMFLGVNPFSTVGAATDGPAHASCKNDPEIYNDVWFRFRPQCDGDYTFSTCAQADYDTKIAVYDFEAAGEDCGLLSDANLLGCSDDFGECANFTSALTLTLTGGIDHLVRIGGFDAASSGSGTLEISTTSMGCAGDINCDGTVNASDIAQLLGAWGPCPGGGTPCPADLNGDGVVDAADLARLLGAWGPCGTPPAPGGPVGVVITENDFSSFAPPYDCTAELNLRVCDVYVAFDDPDARLLNVVADITASVPFYQNPFGTDGPPPCAFIPVFPDLQCDSFVTIGNACDPGSLGFDPDLSFSFMSPTLTGGFFDSNPPGPQARAGNYPNNEIRVARLSVPVGETWSGTITVYSGDGFTPVTFDVSCPPPAPCELPGFTCDDGIPCTDDFCDPANPLADADGCVYIPNDAVCDDGLFCNGIETCDAILGCQPGTPVDCDDENECTIDSCNEDLDLCESTDAPDGTPCSGQDPVCDIAECSGGSCSFVDHVNCDDNDPCTEDGCDSVFGCFNIPIPLPGDVNGDQVVDIDDIVAVVLDFGCDINPPSVFGCSGDANGDEKTDIDDIVFVVINFGNTCEGT